MIDGGWGRTAVSNLGPKKVGDTNLDHPISRYQRQEAHFDEHA